MFQEVRRVLIVVCLCFCAYWPALRLPFISDDYSQIPLARQYAAQGWTPLFQNPSFRTRPTYLFLDAAIDDVFGFTPFPFYAVSILLHVACALLILRLHRWELLDRSVAFWAACFFAIYEGHQEAVMWIAAASDLLVTLFALTAFLFWVEWCQTRKLLHYAFALSAFLLALASKESAWVIPALLAVPLLADRRDLRRKALALAPFLALSVAYVAWSYLARVSSPAYHDVRFSFFSPWPLVWMRSLWRLLFPWGLVALALLLWPLKKANASPDRRLLWVSLAWCAAALVPYCFLTYMLQVPSRHTYLASIGLSWLVGVAATRLLAAERTLVFAVVTAAVVVLNLEILWVKKVNQFRERAEPSELLKLAVSRASGPVSVECSPLGQYQTTWVVQDYGGTALFPHPFPEHMDPHCFALEYHDKLGNVVHVRRTLETTKHGLFR